MKVRFIISGNCTPLQSSFSWIWSEIRSFLPQIRLCFQPAHGSVKHAHGFFSLSKFSWSMRGLENSLIRERKLLLYYQIHEQDDWWSGVNWLPLHYFIYPIAHCSSIKQDVSSLIRSFLTWIRICLFHPALGSVQLAQVYAVSRLENTIPNSGKETPAQGRHLALCLSCEQEDRWSGVKMYEVFGQGGIPSMISSFWWPTSFQ